MRPALFRTFFILVLLCIVGAVTYFPLPLSAHTTEQFLISFPTRAFSTTESTLSSGNNTATDVALIHSTPFFTSGPDPWTYVDTVTEAPITLDPAGYNNEVGKRVIQQGYESLLTYNGADTTTFVPQLATMLPTISEDGLTYTFTIRDGITFHNGNTLTGEDVAYSFQRGILQGGYDSPQYLLTEPLLGAGIRDVSELLFANDGIGREQRGNREAVQSADPALLHSVCEQVTSHIQVDGNRVTFTLTNAWSPFLHILTSTSASVMDKEWVTDNGGWNGDCETWQDYYAIPLEENFVATHINGTGPFQLERIVPKEEVVLYANETYWRTRDIGPAWEGGPVGEPAFKTIVVSIVPTWEYSEGGYYSRFPAMQAGDVDTTFVEPTHYPDIDLMVGERCEFSIVTQQYNCRSREWERGPFRLYRGKPSNTRTDVLFNWAITNEPTNRFLGSGQLDGEGIPPDFFSDVHVRRGFAYCFNNNPYIESVFSGEASLWVGTTLDTMAKYNLYGTRFRYDLARCKAEFAQAWEGVLPTTGFRLQVPYRVDDEETRTILTLLQSGLSTANPLYQLELVGVTPSAYTEYEAANMVPLFPATWTIEVQAPYYWFQSALVDPLPRLANIPETLIAPIRAKLKATLAVQNPVEQQRLYNALNQVDEKFLFALRLPIPFEHHYEQRWVISPGYPTSYYYAIRKE
jgi:peptide/nickel transport system substrate-binding protein